MPNEWSYDYGPNESKRITAWRAHYLAKGCNSSKAETCARRKVWRSHTWPPTVT